MKKTIHSKSQNWRNALLPRTATIEDAIKNLDAVAIKIVLIVDETGKLLGSVSDGDIRRGLLRGLVMRDSVLEVIHMNVMVVPAQMNRKLVRQLMMVNKIFQVPVIDDEYRVIGLHLWEEIEVPTHRDNLMVIMAGGMGKRLMPYTSDCPKPMLPVAGKPMLEHIIQRAQSEGFQRFVLAVHHLGHMIRSHFGDGSRWNVSIDYIEEDTPLGTAGALSLLNPRPDMPFIVTNGDVLTDIHYGELLDFHLSHQAKSTMAIRAYEWQHPFGVVRTRGVEIVGFDEKPISRSHINAGVYALDPQVLDLLDQNHPCDMPQLFERIKQHRMKSVAYPMHEPWLDVGRPSDLAKARARNDSAGALAMSRP